MNDPIQLPKPESVLAEENMASVERQIHKTVPRGTRHNILCPYCGRWNFPHRELCCDLLRQAVIAVLLGDRMMKTAEAGEKAMN
jgi:uncharacterized OB-fold protein